MTSGPRKTEFERRTDVGENNRESVNLVDAACRPQSLAIALFNSCSSQKDSAWLEGGAWCM